MAIPTAVNGQITDAVTQANVKVLGDAPAVAMGNLYQASAQALGNAAHNATNAQQLANMTAQAVTTTGVNLLYGLSTASEAVGISKIDASDLPDIIAALQGVIQAFAAKRPAVS